VAEADFNKSELLERLVRADSILELSPLSRLLDEGRSTDCRRERVLSIRPCSSLPPPDTSTMLPCFQPAIPLAKQKYQPQWVVLVGFVADTPSLMSLAAHDTKKGAGNSEHKGLN